MSQKYSEFGGTNLRDVLKGGNDSTPNKEKDDFYNLLQKMMHPNPKYRANPRNALSHPFMAKLPNIIES